MSDEFFTSEQDGKVGTVNTVEQARAAHHLATADPDVDGPLTGPEHEAKYGLERATGSAAYWRARHADVDRDAVWTAADVVVTADASPAPEAAVPPTPVVVTPVTPAPIPVPAA